MLLVMLVILTKVCISINLILKTDLLARTVSTRNMLGCGGNYCLEE